MKFGYLADTSAVKFDLPPEHPSSYLLSVPSQENELQVYLGAAKWGVKEWKEVIYPKGMKDVEALSYYARHFNSIELNATHYKIPPHEWIERWRVQVPADFKFCPKIYLLISHRYQLECPAAIFDDFCDRLLGFEKQLGACFLQLPPHFSPQKFERLIQFCSDWPNELPLAVELRHPDWFKESTAVQESFQVMQEEGIGTVLTDVAGRRDVLHMRQTNDKAFVRFVGNSLVTTDYTRVDEWIARIAEWKNQGLRELYFFMHQPDEVGVPELSIYFAQRLLEKTGINVRHPQLIPQNVQTKMF